MNNNVCQFYVILGSRNFVPPKDDNVYINATDIHDLKDLSTKILDSYKEKAKLGIKVGSEIVFLVPNEKYKPYTEDIIKKLKVNGKIELFSPKVTTSKPLTIENKKVDIKPNLQPEQTIKEEHNEQPITEKKKEESIKEEKLITPENNPIKKEEKTPIFKPTDNIYRGNINNNTYNNLKKEQKNNKIAIIVFVISLLFFITSLVLLLVA